MYILDIAPFLRRVWNFNALRQIRYYCFNGMPREITRLNLHFTRMNQLYPVNETVVSSL